MPRPGSASASCIFLLSISASLLATQGDNSTTTSSFSTVPLVTKGFKCQTNGCCDQHEWCQLWANNGQCQNWATSQYMTVYCPLACNISCPAAITTILTETIRTTMKNTTLTISTKSAVLTIKTTASTMPKDCPTKMAVTTMSTAPITTMATSTMSTVLTMKKAARNTQGLKSSSLSNRRAFRWTIVRLVFFAFALIQTAIAI